MIETYRVSNEKEKKQFMTQLRNWVTSLLKDNDPKRINEKVTIKVAFDVVHGNEKEGIIGLFPGESLFRDLMNFLAGAYSFILAQFQTRYGRWTDEKRINYLVHLLVYGENLCIKSAVFTDDKKFVNRLSIWDRQQRVILRDRFAKGTYRMAKVALVQAIKILKVTVKYNGNGLLDELYEICRITNSPFITIDDIKKNSDSLYKNFTKDYELQIWIAPTHLINNQFRKDNTQFAPLNLFQLVYANLHDHSAIRWIFHNKNYTSYEYFEDEIVWKNKLLTFSKDSIGRAAFAIDLMYAFNKDAEEWDNAGYELGKILFAGILFTFVDIAKRPKRTFSLLNKLSADQSEKWYNAMFLKPTSNTDEDETKAVNVVNEYLNVIEDDSSESNIADAVYVIDGVLNQFGKKTVNSKMVKLHKEIVSKAKSYNQKDDVQKGYAARTKALSFKEQFDNSEILINRIIVNAYEKNMEKVFTDDNELLDYVSDFVSVFYENFVVFLNDSTEYLSYIKGTNSLEARIPVIDMICDKTFADMERNLIK